MSNKLNPQITADGLVGLLHKTAIAETKVEKLEADLKGAKEKIETQTKLINSLDEDVERLVKWLGIDLTKEIARIKQALKEKSDGQNKNPPKA